MGASLRARRALERNAAIARTDHGAALPAKLRATVRTASPPAVERRPGFRLFERRWRDSSFYLVERRKGKVWMYGSMLLAASLWGYIYLFVRFI